MMFLAVVACAVMVACGSNMSSVANTQTSTQAKSTTAAVVNVGDAPSDSVLSFEVTINSIVLVDSTNQQVKIVSTPVRVELSHLAGTFMALAHVDVPQGTYTGAIVTISNPEIVFINSAGSKVELNPPLANSTINVTFSPNLVVNGTATAFNFDFDLAKSITFDSSGVPTINPVITVVPAAALAAGGQMDPEHGDIEDLKGTVTAVNSTSFVISLRDNTSSLTFNVDANTHFDGIPSLSSLKAGQQVEVSAAMQADGSLLAKRVEVEMELEENEAEGANLEGLITGVTGSPATQLSVLVREMESPMASAPALGATTNVSLNSNTKFAINNSDLLLTSLPFTPKFDASSIAKGQNVEVEAVLSSSTPTAAKVKLTNQSLRGTAGTPSTSNGVTSFTLTLPSDAAFVSLTGASTVTVYQTSQTELKDMTSVAANTSIRVRGLLFFDGTSYKLVAKSIEKN